MSHQHELTAPESTIDERYHVSVGFVFVKCGLEDDVAGSIGRLVDWSIGRLMTLMHQRSKYRAGCYRDEQIPWSLSVYRYKRLYT